jgi:hypothetical protein
MIVELDFGMVSRPITRRNLPDGVSGGSSRRAATDLLSTEPFPTRWSHRRRPADQEDHEALPSATEQVEAAHTPGWPLTGWPDRHRTAHDRRAGDERRRRDPGASVADRRRLVPAVIDTDRSLAGPAATVARPGRPRAEAASSPVGCVGIRRIDGRRRDGGTVPSAIDPIVARQHGGNPFTSRSRVDGDERTKPVEPRAGSGGVSVDHTDALSPVEEFLVS